MKSLSQRKLGVTQELPGFKDLLKLAKEKLKRKRTDQVSIFDLPIDLLAPYAARDARLTYDLEPISVGELSDEDMTDLFWNVETPFLYTILDMEKNGFYIDTQAMGVVAKEFEEKINDAADRWARLSKGINPNSPKQLQVYLYDKSNGLGFPVTRYTDSKQPATDALANMRLAHKDKTGSLAALTNATVLPGLIDCHTHLMVSPPRAENGYALNLLTKSQAYRALEGVANARATLEAGFTTVRDVENEGSHYADLALRDAIKNGLAHGPRMLAATRGIAAVGQYEPFNVSPDLSGFPNGAQMISGVEEARRAVREQIGHGADLIKIYADWLHPTLTIAALALRCGAHIRAMVS